MKVHQKQYSNIVTKIKLKGKYGLIFTAFLNKNPRSPMKGCGMKTAVYLYK